MSSALGPIPGTNFGTYVHTDRDNEVIAKGHYFTNDLPIAPSLRANTRATTDLACSGKEY